MYYPGLHGSGVGCTPGPSAEIHSTLASTYKASSRLRPGKELVSPVLAHCQQRYGLQGLDSREGSGGPCKLLRFGGNSWGI